MTDNTNTTNTKKTTDADKIWDEICNLSIAMYALPNQKVSDHLEKLPVPGNVLYVKPKSPAVIAALGESIGEGFEVSPTEKGYLQIRRVDVLPDVHDDYVVFMRNGKEEKISRKKYLGSE